MSTLTVAQKEAAQGIIAVFETGGLPSIKGYGTVTLLKGDSGGLTYGIHQTTINSGNLYLLIKDYCENPNAKFADQLRPYLNGLRTKSGGLATDVKFKALLKQAGLDDEVMREVQDAFFDRVYWDKATYTADQLGIKTALGTAVIYDSQIHGSWAKIRDRVIKKVGTPEQAGEFAWIKAYNEERFNWLNTHPNSLLRKTVYRQKAFRTLIQGADWSLRLPFNFQSNGTVFKFTVDSLGLKHVENPANENKEPVVEEVTAEGPEDEARLIFFSAGEPLMEGDDVKAVQLALNAKNSANLNPDGKFGAKSRDAVKAFQKKMGLKADGLVGPVTRTRLGL